MDLIKSHKWSVSCSYDILKADDKGGSENNIKYGMEILDGVFTHLALVKNPRYERANIVFNSKTVIVNDAEFESKHPRDEQGRFTDGTGASVKLSEQEEKEVGVALYTINKEAKKIRGIRENLKDFLFESRNLEDNTISFLQNKYPKVNFNEDGAFVEDNYGSVYRDIEAIDEQIDDNQREINYQETKLEDEDEADEAQEEIDKINSELKRIPFGRDIYQFKMLPKGDRQIFFTILDNLSALQGNPDLFTSNSDTDEKLNADVQDFLEKILSSEDENDYSDYRNYFN